jgi:pimeloyl-ACP methyl ester carboxylesterase
MAERTEPANTGQEALAGAAGEIELSSARPHGPTRPPVLCVHAAGHGAWCWERWLPVFAANGHPAYALSLRGHGGSTGSYRGARRADYLTDIATALQRVGPGAILVGHSAGAMLVEHTARHIQDTPAVVLLSPLPVTGMSNSYFVHQTVTQPGASLQLLRRRDAAPFTTNPAYARQLLFSPNLPDEEIARYTRRLDGDSFSYILRDLRRARSGGPLGCPTLVIGGALDSTFTPAQQQRKARQLGADQVVMDGAKHAVMWDHRWHDAAETVLGWLERALGLSE